jgi:hypothetical protein
MSHADDRRAPHAMRIPFDAMVEVGGALGPSFEAQAVNLSEEGMQLRTAYLPEVGQPVTCRFDAGPGGTVIAAGEVLWKEDQGHGGEFGIRFMNMDSQSVVALQQILGMAEEGQLPRVTIGRKVRLHIDGLGSPMRARVKSESGALVTAFSELGFLQMGKPLEVEDTMNGSRRPALIDRVEVEVDHETRVPHLVVSLVYDDDEGRMAAAGVMEMPPMPPSPLDGTTDRDGSMEPHVMEQHVRGEAMASDAAPATEPGEPGEEESKRLKGAFARGAAKVTPALQVFAKRARAAIAHMAERARKKAGEMEMPMRRTTAPPPGGALHAAGRKVVRGEIAAEKEFDAPPAAPRFKMTKKKAVVAAAVSATVILAMVATRKPTPPASAAAAAAGADTAARPSAPSTAGASPALTAAAPPVNDPLMAAADGMGEGGIDKSGKPQAFTNGPVGAHSNTLKLRMDGAIARIQGASQPTGFTVVLPGRKSLDSAGPLAAKDPRIAAIRIANEPTGAELTVTFKDGVPNYTVRAKGDTLEMVLAKATGPAEKSADAKPSHGTPGKRHKKH